MESSDKESNLKNMSGEWKTNCLDCKVELKYSSKSNLLRSMRSGPLCLSCSKTGTRHHFFGKPSTKQGKVYSDKVVDAINSKSIWFNDAENTWYRKCPSCNKNVKSSSASHATERVKCLCYSCVAKARTYSEKCREKMKASAIARIKRNGSATGVNREACKFIDEIGNRNGFNFKHALNGGEKWIDVFAVDGYDESQRIAFEYDEPYHEKRKQKCLDLSRTKRILATGTAKEVIRYSQKYNKLYKSFPTYSIPL